MLSSLKCACSCCWQRFFFSYLISFWLPVFPTFCHVVAVTVLFCTVQFCFLFDINYFRQHQIVLLSPGVSGSIQSWGLLNLCGNSHVPHVIRWVSSRFYGFRCPHWFPTSLMRINNFEWMNEYVMLLLEKQWYRFIWCTVNMTCTWDICSTQVAICSNSHHMHFRSNTATTSRFRFRKYMQIYWHAYSSNYKA